MAETYKNSWSDELGVLPQLRIAVNWMRWRLDMGEHPGLYASPSLFDVSLRSPFRDLRNPKIDDDLQIPPEGCVHGHHAITDNSFNILTGNGGEIPVCPLFVRDLAGRVIVTPLGPLAQKGDNWELDRVCTFPKNSVALPADHAAQNLLENVFMTTFRTLGMSASAGFSISGERDVAAAGYYNHANLYPYKKRLDTFYIDGWRIPQTEYLYVKRDTDKQRAHDTGVHFMKSWADRPAGQSYPEFYEALGEDFVEKAFADGCTIIPTFESFNGYAQVSPQFACLGYHPGRAVSGLHTIVERKGSDLPEGTIIEVVQPGYITAARIEKAKVVVSDGSGYTSPCADDPDPKYPDLRLPHPRLSAKWGAAWIPTHPKHFEAPSLWGWDEKTGYFMQLRGPVWDPLHYYYASVDEVFTAFENQRLQKNTSLARVPEKMRDRFYPVVAMRGFESFQYQNNKLEIYRVDNGKQTVQPGYHPLPLMFEFELDNWWLPDLDPRHRAQEQVPFKLEQSLMATVVPEVEPGEYMSSLRGENLPDWVTDPLKMAVPQNTGDATANFPHLLRYLGRVSEDEVINMVFPYLQNVPDMIMQKTGAELVADFNDLGDFEMFMPGLYVPFGEFKSRAQSLLRKRHELFRTDRVKYILDYWVSQPVTALFEDEDKNTSHIPAAALATPPTV